MKDSLKVITVPISDLLHDDKYAYAKEGHGGKPVWEWPAYRFYKLYQSGKAKEAEKLFVDWYADQYQKYSLLEKSKGGMKNGSLDRLVQRMQGSGSGDTIIEALHSRVRQRFELLDEIQLSGYKTNHTAPISAFRLAGNKYMLFGGHHRVAVLAVLGYNEVPDVYVFKNTAAYFSFRVLRKLKKLLLKATYCLYFCFNFVRLCL